jgi:hypothetical protein
MGLSPKRSYIATKRGRETPLKSSARTWSIFGGGWVYTVVVVEDTQPILAKISAQRLA